MGATGGRWERRVLQAGGRAVVVDLADADAVPGGLAAVLVGGTDCVDAAVAAVAECAARRADVVEGLVGADVFCASVVGAGVAIAAVLGRARDADPLTAGVTDGAAVAVLAGGGVVRVRAPRSTDAGVVRARVVVVADGGRAGAGARAACVGGRARLAVVTRGAIGHVREHTAELAVAGVGGIDAVVVAIFAHLRPTNGHLS